MSSSFSFPNPPSYLSLSSFLSPLFSQPLSWSSFCLFVYFSLSPSYSSLSPFISLPLSLSFSGFLSLSPSPVFLCLSFSLQNLVLHLPPILFCSTVLFYSSSTSYFVQAASDTLASRCKQLTLFLLLSSPLLSSSSPLPSPPFSPLVGHACTLTEVSSSNETPNRINWSKHKFVWVIVCGCDTLQVIRLSAFTVRRTQNQMDQREEADGETRVL